MRENGFVKMFDIQRGFGFIRRSGALDCFFHVNQVGDGIAIESIEVGAAVEFEVIPGRDGRSHAANLVLLQVGN